MERLSLATRGPARRRCNVLGARSPRIGRSNMSELDYVARQARIGTISRREFVGAGTRWRLRRRSRLASPTRSACDRARRCKKGGMLRLGLAGGSVTDSLEPGELHNSAMIVVGRGLFNGLVELAADGGSRPNSRRAGRPKTAPANGSSTCARASNSPTARNSPADDAIYSLNLHRGETQAARRWAP